MGGLSGSSLRARARAAGRARAAASRLAASIPPRRARSLAIGALATIVALATVPAAPGGSKRGPNGDYAPYVPGEILLKFKPKAASADRARVRSKVSGKRMRAFRGGAEHWKLAGSLTVEEAVERSRADADVEFAEPNYIVTADNAPDDVLYPYLWNLNNVGQTGGTPGADISAQNAWDITTGSSNVLVGVIDSGIDYNHPDLAANVWTNPGEIAANGVDDDGNGYIDDVHGWDFYNGDNDPFDDNGHGTHVAGIIGAAGNNLDGVVGVNWQVRLIPLKFLGSGGSGSVSGAVMALDYATVMGARITNNSWGGGSFSQTLLDAINAAGAADGVFVAAAGNSGSDNDVINHFPAGYTAANIIAVAATDHNDNLASFSNYGAASVDIAAPGVDILSTVPRGYGVKSGTSMATPHVTGAAALIRSLAPSVPVATLKQQILFFAHRLPGLTGRVASGGRLDAALALNAPDGTPPGPILDLTAHDPTSNSIYLNWTATGDDADLGHASSYDVRYSTSPIDETTFASSPRAAGAPVPSAPGAAESMEVLGLAAGTPYYLAVEAVDEWGNAGPISNSASAVTLPPPTFSSSPSSFALALYTGEVADRKLTIQNAGDGTLDWRIPKPSVAGPLATAQSDVLPLSKGEPDTRVGDPVIEGTGGPDPFGYKFIDSDEAGGPVFAWNDIAASGTPISGLAGDDQTSGPIPLGFDFPYYGSSFPAVRVSTNGWLSFTSTSTAFSPQPLPSLFAPENLIAALWDDLDFKGSARAVYRQEPGTFIVQYTDVPRFSGTGSYTFQVILEDTGDILMHYLTVTGRVDTCAVGIQDATRSVGLTAAFNTAYLRPQLAVRFAVIPQWLTADPDAGRLSSGQTQDVTVRVDARGLPGGTYLGTVLVETNDPLQPAVPHPVTLDVTDAPAIEISPASLDFGEVFVGFSESVAISVGNVGTTPLSAAFSSSDPEVTVVPGSIQVPPGDAAIVTVTFSPSASRALAASIAVDSDAPNGSHVEIPVTGLSSPSPGISVNPSSFSESLVTGSTAVRTLTVSNSGGSDLDLSLTAELLPSAPPSAGPAVPGASTTPTPTVVNGGFEFGSFAGWTAATNGRAELAPWTVSTGAGGYFPGRPVEGRFDALNGFDGEAGLEYTLYQDVAVPPGTLSAELTFYDRIQFDSRGMMSLLPRIYEATIQDPNGGVLALITHQEIVVDRRPYTDLGWQRRSADLTPFAGRTVRIHILERIPESFTGPGTFEVDGFRIDSIVVPEWLSVSPPAGTIPPGGSLDFAVTFDPSDALAGVLSGAVRIETNIPDAPTLRVPALLAVTGAPNIRIGGAPLTVESSIDYSVEGARTDHALALPVPPAGGGDITLIADGDFGDSTETATAIAEGIGLGTVGSIGIDCAVDSATFAVTGSDLATLASDGVVEVQVRNSTGVEAFCLTNRHTVRLTYRGEADRLNLGSLFVGASRTTTFSVENRGTDTLAVSSISADRAEYTLSDSAFSLAPRTSRTVSLTFAPSSASDFAGALTIASDDPDSPLLSIPLAGVGLPAPVATVQPASIATTLSAGAQETRTLTLANGGGSPLDFTVSVRASATGGASAQSVSCAPSEVIVAEWGSGEISSVDVATGAVLLVAGGLSTPNKGLVLSRDATSAFVAESTANRIAQVDLATGTVRVAASSVNFPTGLALDPNGTTLYISAAGAGELIALDLASRLTRRIIGGLLSPNGIAVSSDGTTLYVAEFGTGILRAIDVATGTMRSVASGLNGPVDVALRADEKIAFVTEAASGELSAVDIATGAVTLVATGLSEPSGIDLSPDGGLAVVAEYAGGRLSSVDLATGVVTAIASVGLANPTGVALRLPAACRGGFLRVDPLSGSVPPFGTIDLEARLDASLLLAGSYAADVLFESNDPVSPVIVVPAALTVTGAPDIAIFGQPYTLQSQRSYTTTAAETTHSLAIPVTPSGPGTFTLVADGDFGNFTETAALTAEGIPIGTAGASGTDCSPARATFDVSPADLAAFAADGTIDLVVRNSPDVDAGCVINTHTLSLTYRSIGDHLEFGDRFVGSSGFLTLLVENRGTDTLHVTGVSSDAGAFVVSPASFTLEPGRFETVRVTFAPTAVVPYSGTLTIASDDADTPQILVPLTGNGVVAPVISVQPASLSSNLRTGEQETQILTISNSGGSPLDFSAQAFPLGGSTLHSEFAGLSEEMPGASDNEPSKARDDFIGDDSAGRRHPIASGSENDDGGAGDPPAAPGDPSYLAAPGDFQPLSSSPSALTCVVADPAASLLYAQANGGNAFYRYVAALNRWEGLSGSPITAANNGGAAILNGKIYTAYTGSASQLGVYDIASDSWSTIPNPLGAGTGAITSDGTRYLYLAYGDDFVRLDPATSDVTPLPAPPFPFEAWSSLRHLGGVVYGHQGNGATGFAAFDVAAGSWSQLPSLPGGAVLGADIDPTSRSYFAYGPYGGRDLYRFSIDTGRWSVSTIPLFVVGDGGMGWLPAPVPGVYLTQGENGRAFGRFITATTFLRIDPSTGSVPPGGSIDLAVTFDATTAPPGRHSAHIRVASNDPATPLVTVPAVLGIAGAANILVTGDTITQQSTQVYFFQADRTMHVFPATQPPAGDAMLKLVATGDFGNATEFADAIAEGNIVGTVGAIGADCKPASGTFTLPAATFAALAMDGVVEIEVQNTFDVDVRCPVNSHTVTLSYEGRLDGLEFPTLFVGDSYTLRFLIRNVGTAVLLVKSIVSDLPEFTVNPPGVPLLPGESQSIAVTFAPMGNGLFEGTLSISSDDPDTPLITVPVSGIGVVPPVIEVNPTDVTVSVLAGRIGGSVITIANTGGSDLIYSSSVRPGPGLPFADLEPSAGRVHAGDSLNASVLVSASDLTPGTYTADIDIASNDPKHRLVTVHVTAVVTGIPEIGVSGEPVTVESIQDYSTSGALTFHSLVVGAPPARDGTIEVLVEGEYGDLADTASIFVESRPMGNVGGTAFDCLPDRATFPLDAADLASLASDGVVEVEVQNGSQVDATCSVNRHTVTLDYRAAVGPIDFGPVFLGGSTERIVYVQNHGTGDLFVSSISADAPEFAASPASLTVHANGIEPVRMIFSPSSSTGSSGTIVIESNDPARPLWTIDVAGQGVDPPVAAVDPQEIRLTLHDAEQGSIPIALSNAGLAPLAFTIDVTLQGSRRFLDVAPAAGVVDPAGEVTLSAVFDSTGLPPGEHPAAIEISTNDPLNPVLIVDAVLHVVGIPVLGIAGDTVSVESVRSFTTTSARTTHRLRLPAPPAEGATLTLTADGDFGDATETAAATAEFKPVGFVGGAGSDCATASGVFTLDAAAFAPVAGDGTVNVDVQNSLEVDAHCAVNTHRVRLSYRAAVERLDFGTVPVGVRGERRISVVNLGTEPLSVSSIAADLAEVTADPPSFDVPPGAEQPVTVSFAPGSDGTFAGTLIVSSDDPAAPEFYVEILGVGIPSPLAVVSPAALLVSLAPGASGTRSIEIRNDGGATLDYTITVRAGAAPIFLSIPSPSGSLPPGGGAPVDVVFDAAGLAPGLYSASIDLSTNDPVNPLITIPANLEVTGASDIAVSGGPIDFGPVFLGASLTRSVVIQNVGTEVLNVASITTDSTPFEPVTVSMSLAPGASVPAAVEFTPVAEGIVTGTLTIVSNDPDSPEVTLPLTGEGASPPLASVQPDSIELALPPGGVGTRTIRIINAGRSALSFSIGASATFTLLRPFPAPASTLPPWITARPASGVVPPHGAMDVSLEVSAVGLSDGDHPALVSVNTDDPAHPRADVPLMMHSGYAPLDLASVYPPVLNLRSQGTSIRVTLQLPPAYDPHEIVLSSVTVNGGVPADVSSVTFKDGNHDGIEEMVLRFNRAAVEATLPEGNAVEVTVTGEVRDRTWFRGVDTIRTHRSAVGSAKRRGGGGVSSGSPR